MNKTVQWLKKYKTIIAFVGFVLAFFAILFFPGWKKGPSMSSFSETYSIYDICELATIESYYHNVAMFEKKPDGVDSFLNNVFFFPFGQYTNVGYKQFWIEYSGIVDVGIDASQVKINSPDANGVVDVYVPDAKVLNVYVDENEMSDPLSETGLFTKITSEEQRDAFSSAQEAMRKEAESDQGLLLKAKKNAMRFFENYIVETGKLIGTEYKVNWLDHP